MRVSARDWGTRTARVEGRAARPTGIRPQEDTHRSGYSHIHALAKIAVQLQQGLRSHVAEVRVETLAELAPLAHHSTIGVEAEMRQRRAAIPTTGGEGIPGGGLEIFGVRDSTS